MVRKIYDKMILIVGWFAVAGMILITFFTAYEVMMRQVFGKPTIWTNEITSYILIWVGLLGVVYAYDKGSHVSVDLIYRFLKPRFQRFLDIFTTLLIFLFAVCICFYGYIYWWMAQSRGWRHFGMLDVPMGYTRIAFPIVGLLLIFQTGIALYDCIVLFKNVGKQRKNKENE